MISRRIKARSMESAGDQCDRHLGLVSLAPIGEVSRKVTPSGHWSRTLFTSRHRCFGLVSALCGSCHSLVFSITSSKEIAKCSFRSYKHMEPERFPTFQTRARTDQRLKGKIFKFYIYAGATDIAEERRMMIGRRSLYFTRIPPLM